VGFLLIRHRDGQSSRRPDKGTRCSASLKSWREKRPRKRELFQLRTRHLGSEDEVSQHLRRGKKGETITGKGGEETARPRRRTSSKDVEGEGQTREGKEYYLPRKWEEEKRKTNRRGPTSKGAKRLRKTIVSSWIGGGRKKGENVSAQKMTTTKKKRKNDLAIRKKKGILGVLPELRGTKKKGKDGEKKKSRCRRTTKKKKDIKAFLLVSCQKIQAVPTRGEKRRVGTSISPSRRGGTGERRRKGRSDPWRH